MRQGALLACTRPASLTWRFRMSDEKAFWRSILFFAVLLGSTFLV